MTLGSIDEATKQGNRTSLGFLVEDTDTRLDNTIGKPVPVLVEPSKKLIVQHTLIH